jgi:hypothetical protein
MKTIHYTYSLLGILHSCGIESDQGEEYLTLLVRTKHPTKVTFSAASYAGYPST